MRSNIRDEFLSEEDLDLRSMSPDERDIVWTAWLKQAQQTNQHDQRLYSHGVFTCEPPWPKAQPSASTNARKDG